MKEIITKSVKSLSHTPQYKMHKYFARRPYNVFSNLVSNYTDKKQTILDIFCGGGVTVFEGCKLERNVIGVDLNPLATFITKMQMFHGDLKELEKQINIFIDNKIEPLKDEYLIHFSDDSGYCKWIEWAYVVECPECRSDIKLIDENKIKNGIYKCQNKDCSCSSGIARTKCFPKTSIPIQVKYVSEKENIEKVRMLTSDEVEQILEIENKLKLNLKNLQYPSFEFPLNWDRQKEDKLFEKGIIRYEDLFSYRNFFLLSTIFTSIINERNNGNVYADYLYFIFSSSLRYTNKMSKVSDNWENGNPTCMDKHAYHLPNLFIENNVIEVFKERAKTIIKGCEFSKSELPINCNQAFNSNFNNDVTNYWIINGSSKNLPLDDESIDIIITDPPYGSNVQYAELSVVWNAWYQIYANKDNYIYREEEAISNRKNNYDGAKNEKDYEKMLFEIFKEAYRVLKNDSYMVFTFNNKNLNIWLAMLRAVAKSGFRLAENGVLFQDFISSYKNTSHLKYAGNVQGDFIYTFVKSDKIKIENLSGKTLDDIIDNAIQKAIAASFESHCDYVSSEILYKNLFTELASNLMKLILYKQSINEDVDNLHFEEKSVDFHLANYLTYEKESGWKRGVSNE